jgi:hypothetical protein
LKVLREGQCLRHSQYGVGIATESTVARTTIEFYEHGRRIFVTDMLDAELLSEAPPRPKSAGARAVKARKPKAAR